MSNLNSKYSAKTVITNFYRGKPTKQSLPWTPIQELSVGSNIVLPSIYSAEAYQINDVVLSIATVGKNLKLVTANGLALMLPVQEVDGVPGIYVALLDKSPVIYADELKSAASEYLREIHNSREDDDDEPLDVYAVLSDALHSSTPNRIKDVFQKQLDALVAQPSIEDMLKNL